jgi:uncharacterized Tic20 family protein
MDRTYDPTIPEDATRTASLLHLSALLGLLGNGIGFILAPLVVWIFKRNDDPFIDDQGKEAVNFQITMTLAAIVSGVLIVVLIGIVLLPIVLIAMVVFPIIAAMRARDGEAYRYPFTIRFVK